MTRKQQQSLDHWWSEKKAKLASINTQYAYGDWMLDYWCKLPVKGE